MESDAKSALLPVTRGGRHDHHPSLMVVSLGGAALLGGRQAEAPRSRWLTNVARGLAPLARRHRLVICHGDPPGLAPGHAHPSVAHMLALQLVNGGVEAPVTCVLTTNVLSGGSPTTMRVLEAHSIRRLVSAGSVVVCAGGAGMPVADTAAGLVPTDEPVDEDALALVLACVFGAPHLLLLSEVDGIYRDRLGSEECVRTLSADDAAVLPLSTASAAKADIATRYVDLTGGTAQIGALSDASAVVAGLAGTSITPSPTVVGRHR